MTTRPVAEMAATPPGLPGWFSSTYVTNEIIVLLAVLQMVTSQMISPFGALQIPLELALALALTIGISAKKVTATEYWLLFVLAIVTTISILQSSPTVFFVNAKQNYLGAVSLIYFSKITHRSTLLLPLFSATSILIVVNRFVPATSEFVSTIALDPDFNLSRFGGVFLSAHFNAFFMSAMLIALARNMIWRGGGAVLVYMTASKFIFAAYIADWFSKIFVRFTTQQQRRLIGCSVIIWGPLFLAAGFYFSHHIIDYLLVGGNNSAAVILSQFLDINYYKYLLNIFPNEYFSLNSPASYKFPLHNGHNEIGFFSLAIQGGAIFGFFCLLLLIKRAPYFAVFILVSMTHNQFILYPIIIYIFTQFGSYSNNKLISANRRTND